MFLRANGTNNRSDAINYLKSHWTNMEAKLPKATIIKENIHRCDSYWLANHAWTSGRRAAAIRIQ